MSINLMDRVWYREDLRTMEKFVALALADSAGDDGACYPSIIRIAKKCSCVPRTVQIATSTESRVGKEWVSPCRSRWSRCNYTKKNRTILESIITHHNHI